MTNDPGALLQSYRQRRRRWRDRIRKIGWVTGLFITTAVIGGAFGLYQRSQVPAPIAAATPAPSKEFFPSFTWIVDQPEPPKDLWAPGTWEKDAASYLIRHAYEDVSSATPPTHRPQHHLPHGHAQSRSTAP